MNPLALGGAGFDIAKLVSYGAVGLGCVLALLAFQLLKLEQQLKQPRRTMIRAIYVFMSFSMTLSVTGFIFEFLGASTSEKYHADAETLKRRAETAESRDDTAEKQVALLSTRLQDTERQLAVANANAKTQAEQIKTLTSAANDKDLLASTLDKKYRDQEAVLTGMKNKVGGLLEGKREALRLMLGDPPKLIEFLEKLDAQMTIALGLNPGQ